MRNPLALIVVFFLLVSAGRAHALTVIDEPYYFGNMENNLHIAASYGLTFTTTMILRRKRFKPWTAVLLGSLTTIAVGTLKERFLDDGYNPNDQLSNAIGIVLSGAVVLTFDL